MSIIFGLTTANLLNIKEINVYLDSYLYLEFLKWEEAGLYDQKIYYQNFNSIR